MANEAFPIIRTTRPLRAASPNVRATHAPINPGNQFVQDLIKLGQVGMQVAMEVDRQHAETRFSKARMAANERMGRQLAKELYEEEDPEKYNEIYERAIAEARAIRPDHHYAGKMFDEYMDYMQPRWSEGVFNSQIQRVEKLKREQKAIEEDLQEQEARDFFNGIAEQAIRAKEDPEKKTLEALSSYENPFVKKLTLEDRARYINEATTIANANMKAVEQRDLQVGAEVQYDLSQQMFDGNITWENVRKMIDADPRLSTKKKAEIQDKLWTLKRELASAKKELKNYDPRTVNELRRQAMMLQDKQSLLEWQHDVMIRGENGELGDEDEVESLMKLAVTELEQNQQTMLREQTSGTGRVIKAKTFGEDYFVILRRQFPELTSTEILDKVSQKRQLSEFAAERANAEQTEWFMTNRDKNYREIQEAMLEIERKWLRISANDVQIEELYNTHIQKLRRQYGER